MRRIGATTVALLTVVSLVAAVPLGAAAGAVDAPDTADAVRAGDAPLSTNPARTGSVRQASQTAEQCESGSASYPVEVEDATGETVTISEDPDRVVTLAPSAAQTMWELDAQDEVVGVSQLALYLEGAEEKANVSAPGFGKYNAERIVELDPDVVLAPNVIPTQEVNRLRDAGLTVYKFGPATSIDDVREKTLLTGALVGHCRDARDAVAWMDANLEAADEAVGDRVTPRVLYVSFGFTAGSETFIDDEISAAGGTNIVAEAGVSGFGEVNPELVALGDPQWLVLTSQFSTIPEQSPYDSTTAVEEGNVVVINPNWLNQPAPRSVVFAVRNMTEAFHGEVYGPEDYVPRSAVEETPTATSEPTTTDETPTATPTQTTDGGAPTATPTATETESEAQPGFGVVLAAVALVAALVVLRRRD